MDYTVTAKTEQKWAVRIITARRNAEVTKHAADYTHNTALQVLNCVQNAPEDQQLNLVQHATAAESAKTTALQKSNDASQAILNGDVDGSVSAATAAIAAAQQAQTALNAVLPGQPPFVQLQGVITDADYIQARASDVLLSYAKDEVKGIISIAMSKFAALPDQQKLQALTLLNLQAYAALDPTDQATVISMLAWNQFDQLSDANRASLFALLGM